LKPPSLARAQTRTAQAVWPIFRRERSFLLADAVGTGKSYISLSLALGLWWSRPKTRVPFRLLVLAGPAELTDSWVDKLVGQPQRGEARIATHAQRPGEGSFFHVYLRPLLKGGRLDAVVFRLRHDRDVARVRDALREATDPTDLRTLALRPRKAAPPGRIEVLVTSPSWAHKQLLGRARDRRGARWMRRADGVIADEVFGAKHEDTIYGRLLRPAGTQRLRHAWRHRRPSLIGLSATLLSRDLTDARAIFELCLRWRRASATRERTLHAIAETLPRFAAALRHGLRGRSRAAGDAVRTYDAHRKVLERHLSRIIARSLSTKRRTHAFWPSGHFDVLGATPVEVDRFPLDGTAQGLLDHLQRIFAESPRASEGLAWFIAERSREGGEGERPVGWTSLTESPPRRRIGRAVTHPKLASLETWILEHYRRSEGRWLMRSSAPDYRFKVVVYVHHLKTAAALSPRRRRGDGPGVRIRRALRDLMLRTCRRIASRNRDLFHGGSLRRPRSALRGRLEKHGWTAERLRDSDRTLFLAACVNAHKGHTTPDKLDRFEATLRGSEIDRPLETYQQLIRGLPDLRAAVLDALGRRDIIAREARDRRAAKKRELVPSVALLDPVVVGVPDDERRRLVHTITRVAGGDIKALLFRTADSSLAEREAVTERLVEMIVTAVRASDRWSRRIDQFTLTPRAFARLRRWAEARHRTPWEVSVQTGEDSSSRTFVMGRFRTPGNPFLLILTNVGTVGVDLHPYCWDVVHYTPEWTPHAAEQKTGRIDRPRNRANIRKFHIGPDARLDHIRVHHLVWPFTYDERILSRLNLRAQLAERLLGAKHQATLEAHAVDVGRLARRFKPLDLAPHGSRP
jgi:hypothetical protein